MSGLRYGCGLEGLGEKKKPMHIILDAHRLYCVCCGINAVGQLSDYSAADASSAAGASSAGASAAAASASAEPWLPSISAFFLATSSALALFAACSASRRFLLFELFLVGHICFQRVNLGLLFGFPGIKTLLGFSLVESAFLDTALKVLHEQYTFLGED